MQLVEFSTVLHESCLQFTGLRNGAVMGHERRECRVRSTGDPIKQPVTLVLSAEGSDICRVVVTLSVAVIDLCVADIVVKGRVQSCTDSADDLARSSDGVRRVLAVSIQKRLYNHANISFHRATLCVIAVFVIARCPSVCLSVRPYMECHRCRFRWPWVTITRVSRSLFTYKSNISRLSAPRAYTPLNSALKNSQTLSIGMLWPSPPFRFTVRLCMTSSITGASHQPEIPTCTLYILG